MMTPVGSVTEIQGFAEAARIRGSVRSAVVRVPQEEEE